MCEQYNKSLSNFAGINYVFIIDLGGYMIVKRRIVWLTVAVLFMVLLLITTPVSANDENTDPAQRHMVIATANNEPISTNRLLYVALRNMGYDVDFVSPIISESYIQANEGLIDGVLTGYPDLHHVFENLVRVPVAIENSNVRVFVREGSSLNINNWDELSGMSVGILENRVFILQMLPDNVVINEKATNRAVLDGLVANEYDVVVLAERDYESLGERHSVIRAGQLETLPIYLYMNKKHTSFVDNMGSVLDGMFIDGSAGRILSGNHADELSTRKTVVHILSASIEVGREDMFNAELRNYFKDDVSVEWMTVNIDANRFTRGQHNMAHIASLLRADLVSRNVSAVVVSGDTALEFLKDYYYLYFMDVPVLFYGVSERYRDIILNDDHLYNFTGIVKNIEARLMVETMLEIFPDTKNLFVANDFTDEGIAYRRAIETELQALEGRLNIIYNENEAAEVVLEQINNLPADSLLMVGSYFVDAEHQYFSLAESKRLLERNCNVPIISFYSVDLEYNAIGGKCLDYQKYGEVIAGMLQMIFDGRSAEDIPIVHDTSVFNRWVFDQIQLDIFNVRSNQLPADSVIINRNLSVWEANPQFFIAMVVLFIVSILLIIGTTVFFAVNQKNNKQKSKLQKELTIEKSTLETIFNSVPEILFVKDLNHNFIRINRSFEKHFGCTADDIEGSTGYENELLASVVDDFMDTEKRVINEAKLIMTEKSIMGADGTAPFFEIIATPLYSNDNVTGIVGVAYDVTHRKEMEDAAQSASRAKSNFLANMSHEMRTPLTAVLGLTELTLETAALDEETHSNLIKVYRSGETILNLVNDILDISKIEADKLEMNPHKYDLPSLLNDTITQSTLYIEEKPIDLVLNITEDLPNYLFGDELRIRQILNNLLSNAFKFTKEGTVELGVRHEFDGDIVWLTAWVKDTGIGIRPEDMDKLFTLYSKMEEDNSRNTQNRRTEGTGLGLSISKKVADMMDGFIKAESEYGVGSTFTVKIKQQYVSDEVIGKDVVESLKNFDYSMKRFENAKMTRINLSYARVLIVDDNSTNLDVAKGLMGLYGMEVDCVTGGQLAVDVIADASVKYDAIFMDHMMPEIDGVEATRIIRNEIGSQYAQEIPIIALTANAIVGNEEMFLSKGFQAFIAKPIDLSRLDVVLRQWVRDKEKEALLPDKVINIEARRLQERRILKEDIPGLDMDRGIAHFGFSEEAYYKVLQSYVKNTRSLLDIIKDVSMETLEKYGVTVHGIKGSSRGVFAKKVANEAEALENAAVSGQIDYITANNDRFLVMIEKLLSDIEGALVRSGVKKKPTKEKPDEEMLRKLLDACKDFEIDDIDDAMEELNNYEYETDNELILKLHECIGRGKYKQVKDILTEYGL